MKYHWGENSKKQLLTCDYNLIILMTYALATSPIDFSIKEGERPEWLQDKYYLEGKSNLKFPESKHNLKPSKALDFYPIPTTEENFKILTDHFKKCANILGIQIECGIDWLGFPDAPHIQV